MTTNRYFMEGVISSQVTPLSGVLRSALVWMQSKGAASAATSPATGLVPLHTPRSTKAQPAPLAREVVTVAPRMEAALANCVLLVVAMAGALSVWFQVTPPSVVTCVGALVLLSVVQPFKASAKWTGLLLGTAISCQLAPPSTLLSRVCKSKLLLEASLICM